VARRLARRVSARVLPGPAEVARGFVDLTYKGILPAYLEDSSDGSRLAPPSAWRSGSRSAS
jgi:hypothetical protein